MCQALFLKTQYRFSTSIETDSLHRMVNWFSAAPQTMTLASNMLKAGLVLNTDAWAKIAHFSKNMENWNKRLVPFEKADENVVVWHGTDMSLGATSKNHIVYFRQLGKIILVCKR